MRSPSTYDKRYAEPATRHPTSTDYSPSQRDPRQHVAWEDSRGSDVLDSDVPTSALLRKPRRCSPGLRLGRPGWR